MRKAENDTDRRLLADIRKFGWHTMGVGGSKDRPAYIFTVGMYHTFKHPDFCIFGLSSVDAMGQIVNAAGELVRKGQVFKDGDTNSEIMDKYTCAFKGVSQKQYEDYFGYAHWFYEDSMAPMLQCVWPDTELKYPWDEGFSEDLVSLQPVLYK